MYSSVLLFLSGSDLMVIMFIALLLFGGEKLPELARGLGKGIRDFKDASEGVKREISNQINSYEEKKAEETTAGITPVTPVELPPADEHTASTGVIIEGTPNHDDPNPIQATYGEVANTVPLVDNDHIAPVSHVHENTVGAYVPEKQIDIEPVKTTHE